MTPQPVELPPLSDNAVNALKEARTKMHLVSSSLSEEDQANLCDFFGREIDSVLNVTKPELKAAKERLGDKGLLSLAEYAIAEVSETGMKYLSEAKMAYADALLAVQKPDTFEHLVAPGDAPNADNLSLFARNIKHSTGDFIALVITSRAGTTQSINHGWRVYPDEIDWDKVVTLIDVLREFHGLYGRPFKVFGISVKFELFKVIRIPGGNPPAIWVDFDPHKDRWLAITVFKVNPPNVTIALAYSIDLVKYDEGLCRRGVIR